MGNVRASSGIDAQQRMLERAGSLESPNALRGILRCDPRSLLGTRSEVVFFLARVCAQLLGDVGHCDVYTAGECIHAGSRSEADQTQNEPVFDQVLPIVIFQGLPNHLALHVQLQNSISHLSFSPLFLASTGCFPLLLCKLRTAQENRQKTSILFDLAAC
jgi:hypothetical protein